MDAGMQSVRWLFKQLQVDGKWAVRTPGGFRWWPDKYAQTIEVIGQEEDPDGETDYLVSVRTDVLGSVEPNDNAVAVINISVDGGSCVRPCHSHTEPLFSCQGTQRNQRMDELDRQRRCSSPDW